MEREAEVHFIVMEYVDGDDLRKVVEREGPLDQSVAADYIRQAADGLAHAHEAGLVHRDIKPANLLLESDGTIRLMDLGLVTALEDEGDHSLTRAHNERVIGTADYLSPEQAIDSHNVDPRSDIYGLGGTLYYLLTGHPPFNEGSLAQRILAHQTKEPESLLKLVPDMSGELDAIINRMMRKKPDNRYQSCADVAAALTHWLAQYGASEWKARHYRLLEQLPTLPDDDTSPGVPPPHQEEYIPIAEPVIPDYESPYTDPARRAEPAIISNSTRGPSSSSVLSDNISDEYFADSASRSGDYSTTGDRVLMAIAVSMLFGLACLVAGVAFDWF